MNIQVYKMFTRSKKQELINNINATIDPLILLLLNKDALLSGSLLYKLLTNDHSFVNGDIDIFCTLDQANNIIKKISKHGWKFHDRYYNGAKRLENENMFGSPTHYLSSIKDIKDFVKNDRVIQLIICDDPKSSIDSFDFNIMKNYFDGNDLEVNNYQDMINKVITIQSKVKLYRIEKYRNRGFIFPQLKEVNLKNIRKLYEFNKAFEK